MIVPLILNLQQKPKRIPKMNNIDPYAPMFNYSSCYQVFNYACRFLINDFIENNKEKYNTLENEYYLYFQIPLENDYIECFKFKNERLFYKSDDFTKAIDNSLVSNSIFKAGKAGVSMTLKSSTQVKDLLTKLSVVYPEISTLLKNIFKDYLKDDNDVQECLDTIDKNIMFLKDWAISHNQRKVKDDNGDYVEVEEIKEAYDKFSCYYLKDDILMFFCSPSANLYACQFNDNGYVLYGDKSYHCFEEEQKLDSEFDSDCELFYDRLYLKHGLKESAIILTKHNNELFAFDDMISTFENMSSCIFDTNNE